ncbi:MAG: 4Fe-4S binding protein [Thermodesulfobacteriota bacterium]
MKEKIFQFIKNRRTVQSLSLVLSNAYFFSFMRFIPCGYLQCSNCALSTFSCPLILIERGAVMASMGMLGSIDSKFAASIMAAIAMLILFGSIFGSFGCGWLCPFGFLQDLLAKIPVKKIKLPGWSGHMRLPIFIGLVVMLPYYSRKMAFCDICPPGTINRLWQQAAGIPLFFKTPEGAWAIASIIILVGVLVAAVFSERPFCSLLCPIGGFHGLFNRFSGVFINVDREKCVDCGRCEEACPQGINPVLTPGHSQCSRCLQCTDVNCKFIKADVRI